MGINKSEKIKEINTNKRKKIVLSKPPRPRGRPKKNIQYIWQIKPMDYIKKVEKLNFSGTNLSESWRVFWQNYEIFYTAAELHTKTDQVKIAIFLNAIGPEGIEIFNTFNLSETEKQKYDSVVQSFKDFCKPKKNQVYESFVFLSRKQEEGESFDDFLVDIKKLVKTCEYKEQESRMLRDRIVQGIRDKQIQKCLLEREDLTAAKAVEIVRAAEATKSQVEEMTKDVKFLNIISNTSNKINKIKNNSFCRDSKDRLNNLNQNSNSQINKKELHYNRDSQCQYCLAYHRKGKCPAYNKKCKRCGKYNHFAAACKTQLNKQVNKNKKQVRELKYKNHVTSLEELYIDSIVGKVNNNKAWFEQVEINNVKINFKLDTGAEVNVLPLNIWKKLNVQTYDKVKIKLEAYGGKLLSTIGEVELKCKIRNHWHKMKFIVIREGKTPILGLEACIKLELLKRVYTISHLITKEEFLGRNKDLFEGLGKFVENLNIEIKSEIEPVVKSARRIPLAIKGPVEKELEMLENLKVIEKTDTPSEWISNIVIIEKPNKNIRLCLDPRPLNKALKPVNHPIPTFNEISSKLAGKSLFTVLDLKDGYWQIHLNEKSSKLCTFSTPFGTYRFKRLPFGIKTAPEIFQKFNEKNFEGIDGIIVYIDDILIAAKDETEHDIILGKVLERARSCNIKFNKDKLQFKVKEVRFLGHIISDKGIACDPERVKVINEIQEPKNKRELQKIMGMINYVRSFIPNLATLSHPIRELLKNDVHFSWEDKHRNCLEEIKNEIKNAIILKPFDEKKEICIQADASKYGLGACMMQSNEPIYFISRSLTETEKNYAQIEKELLAIVFACTKFHFFIYGKTIDVITDHKPLLGVFNKEINNIPNARLQRMMIKLTKYDINLHFRPGKEMHIADVLSRYPSNNVEGNEIPDLACVVHSINTSAARAEQFRTETNKDEVLKELKKVLVEGWPDTKDKVDEKIKYFWKMKNDLTVENGIIFLNERIVVPTSMRQNILEIIHKPHLGIEKTKARARTLVYWPNMTEMIENKIARCELCQKYRNANTKEPYKIHEVEPIPFNKVGMDLFEFSRKTYLVVVDYFSKYIDVLELKNGTAGEVINKLKPIFAVHGIPKQIIADNVPFGSKEFRNFTKKYDIILTTSSPYYPQSNGLAERSVRTAKMLLRTALETKQEFWYLLLEYRNTPVKGLAVSPNEILMNRRMRTLIPGKESIYKTETSKQIYTNIQVNNQRNEKYYNRKASKHEKKFKKNEKIWVKEGKEWQKGEIVAKHEAPRSYIVKRSDQSVIRRNTYFLRPRRTNQSSMEI